MAKKVSMDDLSFSGEAATAWSEFAQKVAQGVVALNQLGRTIAPEQVHETVVVEDNGSLSIIAEVTGVFEASMSVPPGHWWYRS